MTKRDLTGQRFGHWLVLGKSENTGKRHRTLWTCKCDCGTVRDVRGYPLVKGLSKSCGCANELNLVGKRFERWTVIEKAESRNSNSYWKCKCDCGTVKEVSGTSLQQGRSKSCGCYKADKLKERVELARGESNFNKMYHGYKGDANRRGLAFELSKEDFRRITKQRCHYCGAGLEEKSYRDENANGNYIGNGVDRVDNEHGYTLDNCVPCCSECNYAKGTRGIDNFLSWVERVYEHQH